MEILESQLDIVMPEGKHRIPAYLPFLNKYCPQYGINTPMRMAMFIAQIAHESASFLYTTEIASGMAYENRKDLGNTSPGDGPRYKGRGLIQITGKTNYLDMSKTFGQDFLSHPELLAEPEWAVASACYFWCKHGLNELADQRDFQIITRRINGGLLGYEDRLAFLTKAKIVFNAR